MSANAHDFEPARDAVTGLPMIEAVRQRLEDWGRDDMSGGPGIHALLLGLRRFDAVNLAYGTAAGDRALAEVATRLSHFAAKELDGPWLAARAPGGTFLIAAKDAYSRERWQLFAEQLADIVAIPVRNGAITAGGGSMRLSPRIALLRGLNDERAESLLDRLSQTLASAQRSQGRRVVWADGEASRAGRTAAQLEADLLTAIDGGEIEIVFQPQYRLADDRLSGAEALARWNHPTLDRIGAGALFAIAERTDHVMPLSRHIAWLALAEAAKWPEPLRLSLNVTPADLGSWSFADRKSVV